MLQKSVMDIFQTFAIITKNSFPPLQKKRRISTHGCGGCKFSKISSSLLTLPRYLVRGLALTLTTLGVWRHLYLPTVIGVCEYDIDTPLPLIMRAFDNVNI